MHTLFQTYQQEGFSPLSITHPNIYFHIKKEAKIHLVLVTIDEMRQKNIFREELLTISRHFREYLMEQNCSHAIFLYLLLTEDPEDARTLFQEGDCYWILDPFSHRLFVYENWDNRYLPLKRRLENALDTNPSIPFPIFSSASFEVAPANISSDDDTSSSYHSQNNTTLSSPKNFRIISHTTILILLNILVFLTTSFELLVQGRDDLSSMGALSWQSVLNQHQYYRLISCMFLHSGFEHIFNNMLVLLFLGSFVEQSTSGKRFLFIYFSSGILAGCTSMVYNMQRNNYVESVGASGAIFGLMGALTAIILMKKGSGKAIDLRRLGVAIFLSLYSGFTNQGVDNAAHVGGFISGLLITLLLGTLTHIRKKYKDTERLEHPL